jgi:conjugal transfer pilus assembly protein TraU
VTIGFWEPVRLVDVTRTPFCMVGLGGIAIDPGIEVPRGAQVGHDSQTRNSFYHVHWYANPILYWLEVLLDFPCLEQGALDLAYLTEVDPLWADDELTAILNPEAVLFANAPAKAACAADCVAPAPDMRHREPVLVRRLPGLDLPDDRPCRRPYRRRAGLRCCSPSA